MAALWIIPKPGFEGVNFFPVRAQVISCNCIILRFTKIKCPGLVAVMDGRCDYNHTVTFYSLTCPSWGRDPSPAACHCLGSGQAISIFLSLVLGLTQWSVPHPLEGLTPG